MISIESDGTDFNTLGSDVFLFELASNVSFNECGFTDTTVSDQNDFELSNDLRSLR